MTTITIRAIYEHGVLRPVEPLDLPESTSVEIAVRTNEVTLPTRQDRLRAILQATGLTLLALGEPTPPDIPTMERQHELALLFAQPASIADTLLMDREERW